jgi:hypothetical protein
MTLTQPDTGLDGSGTSLYPSPDDDLADNPNALSNPTEASTAIAARAVSTSGRLRRAARTAQWRTFPITTVKTHGFAGVMRMSPITAVKTSARARPASEAHPLQESFGQRSDHEPGLELGGEER